MGRILLEKISDRLNSKKYRTGFIELLILVFGLFMSFQIDRWNEERLSQQDGQNYALQLLKDLQADLEGVHIRIDYLVQVQQHRKNALTLRGGRFS
ncbi:MAG: hypothetical protein ACI9XU_001460 [Arenicella sp.]|jgi:hypothetical protein